MTQAESLYGRLREMRPIQHRSPPRFDDLSRGAGQARLPATAKITFARFPNMPNTPRAQKS